MTSTSTSSDASPTLSTETIAGIVIGVVGGVAVVAAACFYLRCWRKSKGKFTKLRKRGRAVDPEEEFVSGGSSFGVHGRYGHGQQPSVSLEPLLPSSPPQTSQDSIPALSAPQIPLDWSYLPPVLPNIPTDPNYFSLYDTEDPFARIQRAILPTTPVHPIPATSRRVSHEVPLEQYSKYTAKNPGPNTPLFINRTLARHSGPDFFSGRENTPSFSSADPPQSTSSQTGSETVHVFADAPPTPPKPRISILSPLAEHTTPREEARQLRISGSEVDAHSPESIYSQESAQHSSHPPEPQLPSQSSRRSRASQRYSRSFKLSELSTVMEGSTSTMSRPPSRDVSTNSEMQKKPSLTFSELERSSSVSVALSHAAPSTAPELTSFPLLSSNDAFRKSGYSSSTISPSSSRATRYPSLAPSISSPSLSGSNPQTDSAAEWHRPPGGLEALKTLDLPNPHAPTLEIPKIHPLSPVHRHLPAAGGKAPCKARLCAHSPGSVPEVEHRPIVQCGIASIDVTL
ncbi:uncharacterized protein F5147DRAFT_656071 [Suillus discolor]|uniref:Uncharacterized protein n=1 Tax=Suillus discolor TaxID=1912936 RepID=A0A9P7F0I2_9AGAM|nr:uncharacterized protein F5147DRAFT_656071 [Suillus discolor]KAG2098426.1 hypothetical protein F5147DRAFT_656071 [Suillus discolor]